MAEYITPEKLHQLYDDVFEYPSDTLPEMTGREIHKVKDLASNLKYERGVHFDNLYEYYSEKYYEEIQTDFIYQKADDILRKIENFQKKTLINALNSTTDKWELLRNGLITLGYIDKKTSSENFFGIMTNHFTTNKLNWNKSQETAFYFAEQFGFKAKDLNRCFISASGKPFHKKNINKNSIVNKTLWVPGDLEELVKNVLRH